MPNPRKAIASGITSSNKMPMGVAIKEAMVNFPTALKLQSRR